MVNFTRHAGRLLLWLRFQLWQRRRFNRLVLEDVAGRPFLVLPQVFNPALFLTSEFMVRSLNEELVPRGCRFLDMGTGCGVGAVFAAQWAAQVVAVDVNPAAVQCARINCLLNEVADRVTVCQGDLFAPLAEQRFDVILFNPPYFRGTPQSPLDHAFRATDIVERFTAALPRYLEPAGWALVLLSSEGDEDAFLRLWRENGLEITAVARQRRLFEVFTLYRLRLGPPAGKR
jgi:release factor glutamine methyltransferase